MNGEAKLVWSDAWLLYAILGASAEAPAPLEDVVAAGDAMNHAIFTFDELNGGLTRLTAVGLVTVVDKLLAATDLAKEIGSRISSIDSLAALIDANDRHRPVPPVDRTFFTAEDLHVAYTTHSDRFRALYEGQSAEQP